MMAAGRSVLPTPTRQGPRRRRGRRPRNGGVAGIVDLMFLSLYGCLSPVSIISSRKTGLVENLGSQGNEIYEPVLPEHLLSRKRGVSNGYLRQPPDTSLSSSNRRLGRINLPVSNASGHFPSEREMVRERGEARRGSVWDRLSPEKPICRSLRDRIRWPVVPPENLSNDGSNLKRGSPIRRDLKSVSNAFLRPPPDTSISVSSCPWDMIDLPVSNAGLHLPSKREMERERERGEAPRGSVWDRESPGKPICRSLQDRIRWSVVPQENLSNAGSNLRRSPPIRRDLQIGRNAPAAFACPKTLASLKPSKTAVNKNPLHSIGGQRNSFEGPKPFAVILKRKRETPEEAAHEKKMKGSLGGCSGTSAAETNNAAHEKKMKGSLGGCFGTSVAETSNAASSPPAKVIAGGHAHNVKVECKSQEGIVIEVMEDPDMMTVVRGMRTISISAA